MLYVIRRTVIHPGTMEDMIPIGSILTEQDLLDLDTKYGIDEVMVSVCQTQSAANSVAKHLDE